MFMKRKSQCTIDVSSPHTDLLSKQNYNLTNTISNLFCGYGKTDFKFQVERQKTQNNQFNIETEEQSEEADTMWF